MKDVARAAGVSLGTVSNVLNNVPTVTEENRNKVLDAVKALKFRLNTAARTLKTNLTKSIGLVIPDITNPFYPELARGVEDEARKAGFTVFLCNNDRDVQKEREYVNILIEKNVDGMILVKPKISQAEIEEIHEKCDLVLVDINDDYMPRYNVVNVDDYGGVIKAMNLLYEYGHTRIGFISGLMESQSSKCRYEAYSKFLNDKGLPLDETLVKRGSYDWYSGYTAGVELLRHLNPPTAIFASNDLMAIGVLKAARERRLNVPFDLSVIGCDDIDMASLCSPQLTTVRQPKYEVGVSSVEMLLKRLNKADTDKQKGRLITLGTEIILRESLGYVKK
jgi:DNA-binding LacI/PurR family transcriptional regulator